ncbi:MAG: hypothetical protein FWD74_07450 [Actinomycetia bacterium]|nr:hypothetical protein [Actinomycetes bacterium]
MGLDHSSLGRLATPMPARARRAGRFREPGRFLVALSLSAGLAAAMCASALSVAPMAGAAVPRAASTGGAATLGNAAGADFAAPVGAATITGNGAASGVAAPAGAATELVGSVSFTKTATGIAINGRAFVRNKPYGGIYVQFYFDAAYPAGGARAVYLFPAYPACFANTWTVGKQFGYGTHTVTAVALNPYDASQTVIGKTKFTFYDPKYRWGKITSFTVTDPGYVHWAGWVPAGTRVQYLRDGRVLRTLPASSGPRQFNATWMLGAQFAAGTHVFGIRAIDKSGRAHQLHTSRRLRFSASAAALSRAVYRLPGHGLVLGHRMVAHPVAAGPLGVTNLGDCQVRVNVPAAGARLTDVVRHEFLHVLQCRVYDGNVKRMDADAGPATHGVRRLELVADVGERMLGGRFTPYLAAARAGQGPTCHDRRQAANLLNGRPMSYRGALTKHRMAWC